MKLFLSVVTFICLQHTIDALDCYTCTNATYVSECKNTTTCNAGEVCFSDYTQTSNGILFSFGCRLEPKCRTLVQNGNNVGSGSIVGRSGVTGPCSECCKEQRCNRQLCQHSFSTKQCVDSQDIHCTSVGALVDICADTEKAKTQCRRFCGLCDYVNGDWSSWYQWSECQITCGTGTQSRTRNCSEPEPSGGGHSCVGASADTRSCTKEPCPIHGSWADWADWGSCSATCGIGLKMRDRTCSNPYPARYGNHCFGDARDDQVCLASTCTDGGWSSWLNWSTCSTTCGNGIRTRSRTCDSPLPSIQGKYCPGDSYHVETCNMILCPVTNGGWGSWKSWTSCTATCDNGIQSRQRHCDNPKPAAGGDFCDGSPSEVRLCNQQHCPITNGGWGSWKSWTTCTATCDSGIQSRQRHCDNPKPAAGGDFCDGSPSEVRLCNQQHCPRIKASFSVNTATKGSDGKLRFSTVVLNEGSHYDTTTGVFTCQYPGLYAFIANIIEGGSGSNYIYCNIKRNYSTLSTMYSLQGVIDGKQVVHGWGTATGAATLHLMKGDRVYVYCHSSTGTSISHSSFIGFLVSTDP